MIYRWAFLLVAVLSLAGCAASSAVVVGKVRSPIPAADVKLYLSPPKKYEQVAMLDASSKNSWAVTDQGKMDVVVQRLKEEAAKLGANGILVQSTGTSFWRLGHRWYWHNWRRLIRNRCWHRSSRIPQGRWRVAIFVIEE